MTHTNMSKETESFILDLGNVLRDRISDLSRMKKEKQTARRIIEECCTRIRDTLNKLENDSLDEVNENANRIIDIMESQINYLEGIREKAGDILRRINTSDGRNEREMFSYVEEGKELAKDAEVNINEIKRSLHTECIKFVLNVDTENLIKSIVSLGSVLKTRIATSDCSNIENATNECNNNADIETSEYTNTRIATQDYSDTRLGTSEYTDTRKSTKECAYTRKSTKECADTRKAKNECPDTRIATTECSDISLAGSTTPATNISPLPSSLNNQPDVSTESQPHLDDNENLTKRNDISLGSIQLYDTLPCHKNKTTNRNESPICLSQTSIKTNSRCTDCVSNIYETISVSKNNLAKTFFAYESDTNDENESCPTEPDIKDKMVATKVANSFTEFSTQPSSDISKPAETSKWYKPVPVMRFNVKETADRHECNIYDICQCLDGKFLLTDANNHNLKRFDQSYKFIDSLHMSGEPYCVCTAGPGMAVVSLRRSKKIQFVHTEKKMAFAKSFAAGNYCRGMSYVDGCLNVCTGDINDRTSGRIEVYNNKGNLQYCIPSEPVHLRAVIKYIAVTEVGINRFVTMYSSDNVALLSATGTDAIFRHDRLEQPEGICSNGKGDIFVCGYHSNNVFRISPQHLQIEEILNENDGIRKPIAVYYDSLQSRLFITCSNLSEVIIFTVK